MKAPTKKKITPKRQARRRNCLTLKGTQTLGSAAQLRAKITQYLTAGEGLTIDAGAAEAIDLASLQVLIAAQRSAADSDQALSIVAPKGTAIMKLAHSAGLYSSAGVPLLAETARWISAEEQLK